MSAKTPQIVALLVLLAGASCDADRVAPVPAPAAPPAASPHTPSSEGPPAAAPMGPRKRVILEENGLGLPAQNLLADGDFELSTVRSGYIPQLGWLGYEQSNERAVKAETGGLCRTGLRCGVLEPGYILLGKGAAAPGKKRHLATIWAKIPEGSDCDVVSAWALDGLTFATVRKLKSAEGVPIEGAWCRYQAHVPGRDSALWLYVDQTLPPGTVALIDSAVLAPDDGTVPTELGGVEGVTPAQDARLQQVRKRIHDRLGAGDRRAIPPPLEEDLP